RVTAEQAGLAAVLAQQAEQDADGGGLARPVRAEEGVHLAGPDGQVKAVERGGPAERLAQRAHLDRVRHASQSTQLSRCSECLKYGIVTRGGETRWLKARSRRPTWLRRARSRRPTWRRGRTTPCSATSSDSPPSWSARAS